MSEQKTNNSGIVVNVLNCDEKEYRKHPALSYSRLSDIATVGLAAVNAPANNKIGKLRGVMLGSIIDEVISNKYDHIPRDVVYVKKIPGNGTVTDLAINKMVDLLSFTEIKSYEKDALMHFLGSNGFMINGMNNSNFHEKILNYEEYINALKKGGNDVRIVAEYDGKVIKKAINRLRSIPFFSASFKNNDSESVIYQLKFLAKINGIEIKCMLDAIVIDHVNKTICPIDIKTGVLDKAGFEDFFEQAYLKYNYYIQAGLYRKILFEYLKTHTMYKEYKVLDFKFIYSTTNPKTYQSTPDLFIHDISSEYYLDSFKGFNYKGSYYKGIAELVDFYRANVIGHHSNSSLIA
jgi:hypothetical protein